MVAKAIAAAGKKKSVPKTSNTPKKAIIPVDWKIVFLDSLRESPIVSEACKKSKVSRATAYRYRDLAPEFAVEWDKAIKIGLSALEDTAIKRAIDGSDTLMIFLLKAHDPAKYRERFEHTGKDGGEIILKVVYEDKAK